MLDYEKTLHWVRKNYYLVLVSLLVMPLLSPFTLSSSWLVKPETFKFVVSAPLVFLIMTGWLLIFFKRLKLFKDAGNWLVFLFCAWVSLTVFWSSSLHDSMLLLLNYVAASAVYFLFLNLTKDNRVFVFWLKTILWVSGAVGVIAFFQYVFDFSLIRQAVAPSVTFGNKNMAGHFGSLLFPIILAFFLMAKKRSAVFWLSCLMALFATFLVFTRARAAWLSVMIEVLLFAGFVLFDYVKNKQFVLTRHHAWGVVLVLALFFVLVNFSKSGDGSWSADNLSQIVSARVQSTLSGVEDKVDNVIYANERIPAWINTLEMVRNHLWVGVGMGDWYRSYSGYHGLMVNDLLYDERVRLRHLHNDHLEMLAMFGVVGYGLFLLFLCRVFWQVCIIFSRSKSVLRYAVLGLGLGMLGICVNAFFSFPFKVAAPLIFLMIYAGLIANYWARHSLGRHDVASVLLPYQKVLWLLPVIAFVWSLVFGSNFLLAENFYHRGLSFSKSKQGEQDQKVIRKSNSLASKALYYDREYFEAWALLGVGYVRMKDFKKASRALSHALELFPDDFGSLINQTAAYYRLGQSQKAIKTMEYTLALYPGSPKPWVRYAGYLRSVSDARKATLALYRALLLDEKSGFQEASYLAASSQKLGFLSLGIQHIEKAIKARPNDAILLVQQSFLYLIKGDLKMAEKLLDKSVALDSTVVRQLAYGKAKSLLQKAKSKRATKTIQ